MEIEFELVEKENISGLHFPTESLLGNSINRESLKRDLDKAIALGNLEHNKVKIFFEDNSGKKVVHTTIWAVTDHEIVLKQNIVIPINRIHKLEI